MRKAVFWSGLIFLLKPGVSQTPASGQGCDRKRLTGMLTRYLNAVVAHDPKILPLDANVRFTENTVEKRLGDGLWKPASGLGTFRQDIIDVRQGVAGTHIVMLENGAPRTIPSAAQSSLREESPRSTRPSCEIKPTE